MLNKTYKNIPSNIKIDKAIRELPQVISRKALTSPPLFGCFHWYLNSLHWKAAASGVLMQNTAELQTWFLKLVHEKNKLLELWSLLNSGYDCSVSSDIGDVLANQMLFSL